MGSREVQGGPGRSREVQGGSRRSREAKRAQGGPRGSRRVQGGPGRFREAQGSAWEAPGRSMPQLKRSVMVAHVREGAHWLESRPPPPALSACPGGEPPCWVGPS